MYIPLNLFASNKWIHLGKHEDFLLETKQQVAPCKVIQESLGFRIPGRGFQSLLSYRRLEQKTSVVKMMSDPSRVLRLECSWGNSHYRHHRRCMLVNHLSGLAILGILIATKNFHHSLLFVHPPEELLARKVRPLFNSCVLLPMVCTRNSCSPQCHISIHNLAGCCYILFTLAVMVRGIEWSHSIWKCSQNLAFARIACKN